MVDTTTFRSFHRAPRSFLPVEAGTQPDSAPIDVALTDDAAQMPIAQDLRARRKTVRSAWSLVKADPPADSPLPPGADAIQAQPTENSPVQDAAAIHEPPPPGLFEEASLHSVADVPPASEPGIEPPSEPMDRYDSLVDARVATSPPAEPLAALVLPADEPPFSTASDLAAAGPSADLTGDAHHQPAPDPLSASEDPWPVAAPPDESHTPIASPLPPEGAAQLHELEESGSEPQLEPPALPTDILPEPEAISAEADPGHPSSTGSMPAESDNPVLPTHFASDALHLNYQLLGLASPLVCTVIGRLGDSSPVQMSVGRSGIYRPEGHRTTPWDGSAYQVSSDGRTGLLSGMCVLTARGSIAVEDLLPGDSILTLRGPALLPIAWIGRSIASAPPVQIEADAFGPGRPSRPLCIGADHLIFLQTNPVPAHTLINGHSIYPIASEAAELFHIDVGLPEVIFVEGIPVASGLRS